MKQRYEPYQFFVILLILSFVAQTRADEVLEERCQMSFPEAMTELQETILQSGYKITRIQKVDKGLKGSGYESDIYRIVFFGRTNEVIKLKEKYPELIPLLPLKIALYAEKDESVAVVANPEMYSKLYKNKALNVIFMGWKQDIQRILRNFKARCQEH